MNFDTTEIILLIIMFIFGFLAVFVTKKPATKKPEDKIVSETIKFAPEWKVYQMDKDGNCINSASIPRSDSSFMIGSSPDSDFRILNNHVSRKHLIVVTTDDSIVISDNNSSYSTFINGDRITDSQIENNQVVWLADSPIIFVAPGSFANEEKLKSVIGQNINDYGVPDITEEAKFSYADEY